MIRKQVYLTADQDRLLKRRAREQAVSEAQALRDLLDEGLSPEAEKHKRQREAWERLEALMKERALIQVPQTGRTWTREELYDERLDELAARRHKHSGLLP